jgi:hypothetical protein
MPRVVDKIIINTDRETQDYNQIHAEHLLMLQQANEIKEAGLLDQTDHFTDAMRVLCAEKAAANRKYLEGCRQLTEDLHKFLDAGGKQQP